MPVPHHIEREIDRLRSDARYAYLDGRNRRAQDLTRRADRLAAELRAVPQ